MKTELTDDLIVAIQSNLFETKCLCGKLKQKGHSFARECYRSLPPAKRHALYQGFGKGYEEAFVDAANFLGGHPVVVDAQVVTSLGASADVPVTDREDEEMSLLGRATINDTLAP